MDFRGIERALLHEILYKMKKLGQVTRFLVPNRSPPDDIRKLEEMTVEEFIDQFLANQNDFPNITTALKMQLRVDA
jgi:hypothetical protein